MIFTVPTSKQKIEKEEEGPNDTDCYEGEEAVIFGGPAIHRLFQFGAKDIFGEALFALIGNMNGFDIQTAEDGAAFLGVAIQVMNGATEVTTNHKIRFGWLLATSAAFLSDQS